MRKRWFILLSALLMLSSVSQTTAQLVGQCTPTYTTYFSLYKPCYGQSGSSWWASFIANFDTIDAALHATSPYTSGTAIQKANGLGGLQAAAPKTDYAPPTPSNTYPLTGDGGGGFNNIVPLSSIGNPGSASSIPSEAATRSAINASTAWFNVKDPAYGAKGDHSTNDTTTINSAISACNTVNSVWNPGTLYFPPGTYMVIAGSLSTVNCNIYGPGANIMGYDSTDSPLITFDDLTFGRFIDLHGIYGYSYQTNWQNSIYQKGISVRVIRGEHSWFKFKTLEGLTCAFDFNSNTSNYHIGECTLIVQTVAHNQYGINFNGGSTQRCEANKAFVGYFQNCGVCTLWTNYSTNGGWCFNNYVETLVMELNYRANLSGFQMAGNTPADTKANVGRVIGNLIGPSGTGYTVSGISGIGVNRFGLCNFVVANINVSSAQIFNDAVVDWTNGRSVFYGSSPPSGAFLQYGDQWWSISPAASGAPGQIYTSTGWKAMANLGS